MKPKLVHVLWEDACMLETDTWCHATDHTYVPKLFENVGFLLADTPEGIILTHTWSPEGEIAARDQIPRGMIRQITELKLPRKKKT